MTPSTATKFNASIRRPSRQRLLVAPARAAFEQCLTGRTYRQFAEIRLAQLGADAGLIGASYLARDS